MEMSFSTKKPNIKRLGAGQVHAGYSKYILAVRMLTDAAEYLKRSRICNEPRREFNDYSTFCALGIILGLRDVVRYSHPER